jgi:hypothetical protein
MSKPYAQERFMARVALFRANPFQEDRLLRSLSVVAEVVDVCHRGSVQIEHVTLDSAQIAVCGVPLTDFDHALFLGHPAPSPLSTAQLRLDERERQFEADEWATALVCGLLHSGVHLLNAGMASGTATHLVTKPGQVNFLARSGWRTPSVLITRTKSGEECRSYGCDKAELRRMFLCLSQNFELVFPAGAATDAFSRRDLEAVRATREAMVSLRLDWLTLSLGIVRGRVFAFGATTELPAELGDGAVAALLASCIRERPARRINGAAASEPAAAAKHATVSIRAAE